MRQLYKPTEVTARTLLAQLGIGQFNATQAIIPMFTQPATTDPKSPAIILIVKHIQIALNQMGANLLETGYLDLATASALNAVVGERWETLPWFENVRAVVDARASGVKLRERSDGGFTSGAGLGASIMDNYPERAGAGPVRSDLGFDLPDVPGGIVTYGVAAYLLFRYLKKRKG